MGGRPEGVHRDGHEAPLIGYGVIMDKAKLVSVCGTIPLLGPSLRKIARWYPEGSVTTIKSGHLAGYRWRRSHRYVSGYWLGHYELPIQQCLARELRTGDVFYDVGANAGFFSLLASKCVGSAGKVFAFEPLPENACSIRSQLELNDINNCTVVQAAVSDRDGTIEFSSGEDTSTAHIKGARGEEDGGPMFSVRTISLDQFTQETSPPDFIKMDIEGAEILALEGAAAILGGMHPPRMLIEFHGEELAHQGHRLLAEYDYDLLSLTGDPVVTGSRQRHVLCVPRGKARGPGDVDLDPN